MATLIDDIVQVARDMGAEHKPISPSEMHGEYLDRFPDPKRGRSLDGFTASFNFHCINMPSRFPTPKNPHLPAAWLTKPLFKRISRGQYMLLSSEEIARFRQCDREGNPLIYEREYDVAELPPLHDGPKPGPVADGAAIKQRISEAQRLIAACDYQSTLSLVDATAPIPALRGLRGVALAYLGKAREAEALEQLSYAWRQGDRQTLVARELATLHRARRQYELAAGPYEHLLAHAPALLEPADYRAIALLVLYGVIEQVGPQRWIQIVDTFRTEITLFDEDDVDIAREYVGAARSIGDRSQLMTAYQYNLDVLAALAASGRFSNHQHFDLLDEVEGCLLFDEKRVALNLNDGLRQAVVDGYAGVLQREIGSALRDNHPLPTWTNDLRRFLFVLDPHRHDDLFKDYLTQRDEQRKRGLEPPPEPIEPDSCISLNNRKIALVGGHENVRREVQTLLKGRNAQVVEVPPSSEARVNADGVLKKIHGCDLVVLIVGYMGHDLSTIIGNHRKGGAVMRVQCRGRSGVFREIVAWANQHWP